MASAAMPRWSRTQRVDSDRPTIVATRARTRSATAVAVVQPRKSSTASEAKAAATIDFADGWPRVPASLTGDAGTCASGASMIITSRAQSHASISASPPSNAKPTTTRPAISKRKRRATGRMGASGLRALGGFGGGQLGKSVPIWRDPPIQVKDPLCGAATRLKRFYTELFAGISDVGEDRGGSFPGDLAGHWYRCARRHRGAGGKALNDFGDADHGNYETAIQ